ncbi:MAG: hypothetical protein K2M34_02810 [Alphaproteobacteria bacterium]|nr:hypothetical protein [Alphaproteobacteria bacterium]
MKIMEILKLWIRCLVASKPALGQDKTAIRHLLILARVVQEYYTSGLCDQDDRLEMTNSHTHPYLYDGTPVKSPGFQKISAKYNLTPLYEINLEFFVWCLTDALRTDIKNKTIQTNGSINYINPKWVTSETLTEDFYYKNDYINPQQGLPLTLAQIIAQKTK